MTDARLPARVRRLFRLDSDRKRGAESDADEELSSVLGARTDDFVARGMTRVEAQAEAWRRLGNAPHDALRDRLRRSAVRRERRLGIREQVEAVASDLRIGARRLVKEPLIGDRARTVSQLAATGTAGRLDVRLTPNGEFEHPNARFVSDNYFRVLGVHTQRGRVFGVPEGGAPASSPVAVISDAYWRDRFNGASDVIGRDISVDGVKLTVVGVTQRGFTGDIVERPTDIWLPIEMRPALEPHGPPMMDRETCWLLMVGRLAPGATLAQARAEFTSLIRTTLVSTASSPDEAARYVHAPVDVVSGAQGISSVRRSFRSALVTLQVGVGVSRRVWRASIRSQGSHRIGASGALRRHEAGERGDG